MAITEPSGLNSAQTRAPVPRDGANGSSPVCAFQYRAVPSAEAVTTHWLSRLNRIQSTEFVCLVNSVTREPFRASQTRADRSLEAVANHWPSGLKWMQLMLAL